MKSHVTAEIKPQGSATPHGGEKALIVLTFLPPKRLTPKPNHIYRAGGSKMEAQVAHTIQQRTLVPSVNLYCEKNHNQIIRIHYAADRA